MQASRNCNDAYPESEFKSKLFEKPEAIFNECPVSVLFRNQEMLSILHLIEDCEGEFGNAKSPTEWLEETEFYHHVRRIVLIEKGSLHKLKQKEEDRKGKRGKR